MIKFENVTATYSNNIGIFNLTFHIPKGELVFLMGPTGAGKSTVLRAIYKDVPIATEVITKKDIIDSGANDIKELLQSVINGNKDARKYFIYLIIATIPVVCAGLLFKDIIESTFSISIVKWMLLITGLVVGSTYFFQNKPKKELILFTAICIGFAQVFSLLPGISRSGFTISIALIMGIHHQNAAKFAFFMAIPVLFGVGLLQLFTVDAQDNLSLLPLIIGFISSAVTGYLVINWLLAVISRGKFYLFSLYCFVVSLLAITIIN